MCANCGCDIPENKHDDDRNINWSQIVAAAEANSQTPKQAVENITKMAQQQAARRQPAQPWWRQPFTPQRAGLDTASRAHLRQRSALMAKLTPKQRAELPAREFGLPEKARSDQARKEPGNYPLPDKGHAISAKRLSRLQRKAGNLTKDEFDRINRKTDKILKAEGKS